MKSLLLWIYSLIVHLLPETRCFGLKAFLLRRCGARIGRNVRINSSVRILGTGRLEIGDTSGWARACSCPPSATRQSRLDLTATSDRR